jgi:hypothetical protein
MSLRDRVVVALETAWVVATFTFLLTLPVCCAVLARAFLGFWAPFIAFGVAAYAVYGLPLRVGAGELRDLSAAELWGHNVGRAVRAPLDFFTARRNNRSVGGAQPVGVRALLDASASPPQIPEHPEPRDAGTDL